MSQSNRIRSIAVAAFAGVALNAGAAWAATPTATDPSQESAATPQQAAQPRLPAAQDTHRAGPTQSEQGSGAVPAVPETLTEEKLKEEMGASSAERMEKGRAGGTANQDGPDRPRTQ